MRIIRALMRLTISYGDHAVLHICTGENKNLVYSSCSPNDDAHMQEFMRAHMNANGMTMYRNSHYESDSEDIVGDVVPPGTMNRSSAPVDEAGRS